MCPNPVAPEDERLPDISLIWIDEIQRLLLTPKTPEEGTDYAEMLTVMKLIEKIQAFEMPDLGDGELQLEDTEHTVIVERLKAAKFRFNSPEIFEMIKTVSHPKAKNAPTANPNRDEEDAANTDTG